MNSDSYWGFFSHTTDVKQLEKILNDRYGIDCDVEDLNDLEDIYQTALELCKNIVGLKRWWGVNDRTGVTDKVFFNEIRIGSEPDAFYPDDSEPTQDVEQGVFHYLCVDSLFHIEKELQSQQHNTINQLFKNAKDYLLDPGKCQDPDLGNFKKCRTNEFMNSIYVELLGLSDDPEITPKFMDRLVALLVHQIKKNPFNEEWDSSAESLYNFFCNFFDRVHHLYPKDKNSQYIADYLAERLFPWRTIRFASCILSELQLPIHPDTVVDYLSPVFFLPNFFDAPAYLTLISSELKRSAIKTKLDEILYSGQTEPLLQSPIQVAEHNLNKCRQYLLFLTTVYFPVLNACFYVLLDKTYHSDFSKIKESLIDSLDKQPSDSMFDFLETYYLLSEGDIKKHFVTICSKMKKILLNPEEREYLRSAVSLDYFSSFSQQQILLTVIKQKCDTKFLFPMDDIQEDDEEDEDLEEIDRKAREIFAKSKEKFLNSQQE